MQQSAYQLEVYMEASEMGEFRELVWSSGWKDTSQQSGIAYEGRALQSKTRYAWRVRVRDGQGESSPWSQMAEFETGMLEASDWQAQWVGGDFWFVRKEFDLPKKAIKRARAYVSGLGQFHFHVNGESVAREEAKNPGISQYENTILYRIYDIGSRLEEGQSNAIGFILGPNQNYSEMEQRKCIAQIEVWFEDGTKTKVLSDENWKGYRAGPISMNTSTGIEYAYKTGEFYDAREELFGWDRPGYSEGEWEPVQKKSGGAELRAQLQPITKVRNLSPVAISNPEPGVYVADFGLNISGWVQIRMSGRAGQELSLTYGENIYRSGRVDPRASAHFGKLKVPGSPQLDRYTFSGDGVERWEPFFTLKGFRYLEIAGMTEEVGVEDLLAREIYTDVKNASYFSCSNPLFNKIQKAYRQAMLNCLQSIPVDNVHEEHQGWLGEDHFLSAVRHLNFDMAYFYDKWLRDIRDSQREDGSLPYICPWPTDSTFYDGIWSAAVIISAWDAYQATGDLRYLEDQYSTIKKWLKFYQEKTNGLIAMPGMGRFFGHVGYELALWEDTDYNPNLNELRSFGGTAYFFEVCRKFAEIGRLLEKEQDVRDYEVLATRIAGAFNDRWLKEGYYFLDSQTTNAVPLYVGLVPDEMESEVFDAFIRNLYDYDLHWTGGIVFLKHLFETLCRFGAEDVAYRLADATHTPSYGHAIERLGATAIIEHLDGDLTQSFSQNTSGDISLYFYEFLAGIQRVKPGYEEIRIKPVIPAVIHRDELNWVDAQVETILGIVKSSWRLGHSGYELNVQIPVNVKARIFIPAYSPDGILESDEPWSQSEAIELVGMDGDYAVFSVGSGSYFFHSLDIPDGEIYPFPEGAIITEDIGEFSEFHGVGDFTRINDRLFMDGPDQYEKKGLLASKALLPIQLEGNFSLEADFTLLESSSDDGFAMIFGYVDELNYSYISFNMEEPMVSQEEDWVHGLFSVHDGVARQYRDIFSAHELQSGSTYRLKLRLEDGRLIVFIEDDLVFIIPKFDGRGKVGFGSRTSDFIVENPKLVKR